MALDFGKGNRSVAFNPTSAFPLDARSYFESYELAVAAAQSAEEASSTNTQYYFGQSIVVVENGVASFYIIQPDGTLGEVGGKVEINENVFAHDADDKLSLYGFAEAVAGAQLTKSADGKLSWIKPDTTTVEGLSAAVEGLRTDVDTLTANVYTKTQTDKKIADAIADATHLKREVVTELPAIEEAKENIIYMVPSGLQEDDNKYYEYILLDGRFEKVGSWEVNLNNYATTDDLQQGLSGKVSVEDGKSLVDDSEIAKLKTVSENAEENFIKEVDTVTFQVINGKLELLAVAQEKITGLTAVLNNKVDAVEGKGLSTNDFTNDYKEKLDNLNLNDITNLQTEVGSLARDLHGYVDDEGNDIPGVADVVDGLNTTVGTLRSDLDEVEGKVATIEGSLKTISETVEALPTTYVTVANFNQVIGDMDTLLTEQINIMNQINDINDRLTWGSIPSFS